MSTGHYGLMEAEDFSFDGEIIVKSNSGASGDAYTQSVDSGWTSLSTTVEGVPGVYDLVVSYWDENDGNSRLRVLVDGEEVDDWRWDRDLGSSNANPTTYTERVISNVTIDELSRITLEGRRDGSEPLRIDKVELRPAEDRDLGGGVPAFEGAEGFGSDTAGGRGGLIVKVTNLDDSGVGSLRWALEDFDVPRIVVFEVGGLITLEREIFVKGDVTVAGQTAPGEGVTVRGGKLHVVGEDVIIRGMKLRPGEGPGQDLIYRDAISLSPEARNVVVDRNSFSWSTDELVSIWGGRNVTFSNNIMAEALRDAGRPDQDHSMGMLIGNDSRNVTIADNLFVSNEFRNPTIAEAREVEIVNNYIYNPGQHALSFTVRGDYFTTAHVVGNYFERGPSDTGQKAVRVVSGRNEAEIQIKDNLSWDRVDESEPENRVAGGSLSTNTTESAVFQSSGVTAMSARETPEHVLATAGARAQGLDAIDTRILNDVLRSDGEIIDRAAEGGGYGDIPTVYSRLDDTDGDGIPDVYEAMIGSDPDRFDPHDDVDGDGYGNIENYINGLFTGVFGGGNGGGGNGGGGNDGGGGVAPLFVEAEAFDAIRGFAREGSKNASGGAVLKGGFEEAEAVFAFTGAAGLYDITVRYVDETDGVSRLALAVDGDTIDTWLWSRTTGDNVAAPSSFTERTISNVQLAPGAAVTLAGRGDGGEPLRVDAVSFLPALGGGETGGGGGDRPVVDARPFAVEAETMTLVDGFEARDSKNASGGAFIQGGVGDPARAELTFDGADGVYDVTIRYVDETDGVSRLALLQDGRTLDEWRWDADLGVSFAGPVAFTERTVSGVSLERGEVLTLAGEGDGGEPLRVDSILFQPLSASTLVEAETMELLSGFTVRDHDVASGGQMIGSGPDSGAARAQTTLDLEAGVYDIAIRHSDENDGIAEMSVLLNGDAIDNWRWNGAGGDSLVTPASLTDRIVRDVELEAGDVIELAGQGVGGEPLRVDYLEFIADSWG